MHLTRGARGAGAGFCAVLAALTAAWIVRDLLTVEQPLDLWWFWTGDGRTTGGTHRLATSLQDPVLAVGYAVTAATALRSGHAAAALAAAGVVTLALRLPGLWLLSAQWEAPGGAGGLRTPALVTVVATLALAVGLVLVAAGRPPYGSVPGSSPPSSPSGPASVTVSLLLAAAAAVRTAWEAHWATQIPADSYADRFTGGAGTALPLLGIPPGWLDAVMVLVLLTAAGGLLLRTASGRPYALIAAGLLAASGIAGCALAARYALVSGFASSPLRDQLAVTSWLFDLVAGAVVLVLTGRGVAGETAGATLTERGQDGGGDAPDLGLPPPPATSPPPGG
ncbi:hypothetical protein [Streptomyces sp. NPDC059176]|uniref:hypothetical protein n=1 Tax=unclassified Streptomyces TaxID=2593676 RepID=UPI0036A2F91F